MTTGTDYIRKALYARNKKLNLGNLARDMGVPSDLLERFIEGTASLQPPILCALALDLFAGSRIFDPEADLLRPAKKQSPTSLGVLPPPFVPDECWGTLADLGNSPPRNQTPTKASGVGRVGRDWTSALRRHADYICSHRDPQQAAL